MRIEIREQDDGLFTVWDTYLHRPVETHLTEDEAFEIRDEMDQDDE